MIFYKYFFLKNQEIYTDKVVNINDLYESVSQKLMLQEYYKSFNHYFRVKDNNLNYCFYIDQTDLFRRFVFVNRYKKLFRLIYEGKVKAARIGYPYLSELVSISSKIKGNFIFMPQRYFYNQIFLISSLLKIFFNCISFLRLIFNKIFSKINYITIHTSNNFYKKKRFDYRISHLVEELDKQKKSTVFFIRTRHKPHKIFLHSLRRNRLAFYTDNIVGILYFFNYFKLKITSIFDKNFKFNRNNDSCFDDFLLDIVFNNHKQRVNTLESSKFIFRFLYKLLGTKYFIGDNSERSIMEFLSAKNLGIKTLSFQNGTEFDFFMVHKFINNVLAPNLNALSHDLFFTWNTHWNNYYIKRSYVFNPDNLKVGGFYRDIRDSNVSKTLKSSGQEKLPILFLIENETPYLEIINYVLILLRNNYKVVFKKRPQQRDAGDYTFEFIRNAIFEEAPNLINSIESVDLSFDKLDLSLYKCALGSYTTAIIDCLSGGLDILLLDTPSWADCFDLNSSKLTKNLYCKTPETLIERVNNLDKYKDCQNELRNILIPIYNKNLLKDLVHNLK